MKEEDADVCKLLKIACAKNLRKRDTAKNDKANPDNYPDNYA